MLGLYGCLRWFNCVPSSTVFLGFAIVYKHDLTLYKFSMHYTISGNVSRKRSSVASDDKTGQKSQGHFAFHLFKNTFILKPN